MQTFLTAIISRIQVEPQVFLPAAITETPAIGAMGVHLLLIQGLHFTGKQWPGKSSPAGTDTLSSDIPLGHRPSLQNLRYCFGKAALFGSFSGMTLVPDFSET